MWFFIYLLAACVLTYAIWPLDLGNYLLALVCVLVMTLAARMD